jgi:hypothetical protein
MESYLILRDEMKHIKLFMSGNIIKLNGEAKEIMEFEL